MARRRFSGRAGSMTAEVYTLRAAGTNPTVLKDAISAAGRLQQERRRGRIAVHCIDRHGAWHRMEQRHVTPFPNSLCRSTLAIPVAVLRAAGHSTSSHGLRSMKAGLILRAVLAGTLVSCSADSPTATNRVVAVRVLSSVTHLEYGQSTQLTAEATAAGGKAVSGVIVRWTSSNDSIVAVTPAGLAIAQPTRGNTARSAVVTAEVSGVSGSLTLAVLPTPVHSVRIHLPGQALFDGDALQLGVSMTDVDGHDVARAIEWQSSNPSVLSVSITGLLRAVAPGRGVIRALAAAASDSVALDVTDGLFFAASRAEVPAYSPVSFSWSAPRSHSCLAAGEWTGTRSSVGADSIWPLMTGSLNYQLACTDSVTLIRRTKTLALTVTQPTSFPETCAPTTNDHIRDHRIIGNYVVFRGSWGIDVNPGLSPNNRLQCVSGYLHGDVMTAHWRWHYDVQPHFGTIMGYPNTTFGYAPGWDRSTTPSLPTPTTQIGSLTLDYSNLVGVETGNSFNALIEFNFHTDSIPRWDPDPAKANLALELSVIPIANFAPYAVIDTVTLSGILWRVNWIPQAKILIMNAADPRPTASLRVEEFANYALSKGYLSPATYLGSVQVGNEPMGGAGSAVVMVRVRNDPP
jgi:hypothetical protein